MNLFFQKKFAINFYQSLGGGLFFLRIILSDDELCFCPSSNSLQRRSLDYMHAQRYKKGHQSSVYSSRLLHEPASVLQRPAASNISLLLPILSSTHISCYFIGPLLWLPVLPTPIVRMLGKIGKIRYMLEAAVRWRTEAGSCSNLV